MCTTRLNRMLAAVTVLVSLVAVAAAADDLPKPAGRVILTVTGSIGTTNAPGRAELDWAMLEKLGMNRLQTSTPWTEGRPQFEGVLMRDLINALGAHGDIVTVVALNDYKMDIPLEDFRKYPVLLAMKVDGNKLQVKEKGPLWLIYPQDDFPELKNKPTQAKWVWQIKEMRFE
jgi:hypothetical protein